MLKPISDQSSACKSSRRSHTASSKSAKATATQSSEVQITRPMRDISPSVSGIFHRTSLGGRSGLGELPCKNEGIYIMTSKTSKNLSNLIHNILNHIQNLIASNCIFWSSSHFCHFWFMFQKANLPGHKEFCKASSNGSGSAAFHGFAAASRWSSDSWASKWHT